MNVGNVAEATIAAGLAGWSTRAPDGWELIGTGCSRKAYKAPSGTVYKVPYSDSDNRCQDREYVAMLYFALTGMPEGWAVAPVSRYRANDTVVLAMPDLGGRDGEPFERPPAFTHEDIQFCYSIGVQDPHGGNLRYVDGKKYIIDFGFVDINDPENWAD